ncbi:hypothetical protein [Streptomyces sulfonofaciens]|nr:hypothetical protein [Streptomyces sulfonofaciens]
MNAAKADAAAADSAAAGALAAAATASAAAPHPGRPGKPVLAAAGLAGALLIGVPLLLLGRGQDGEKNVSSQSGAPEGTVLGGADDGTQGGFAAAAPDQSGPGKHRGAAAKNEKPAAHASPSDVPQTRKKAKHAAPGTAGGHTAQSHGTVQKGTGTGAAGHVTSEASRTARPHAGATTLVIGATRTLNTGQSWTATRARMVMQGDGNLVIYDENGHARWASHTSGSGNRAVFQADGNLVVYNSASQPLWTSQTAGHNGAELVLQNDGNVVIEQGGHAFWTSGTAH